MGVPWGLVPAERRGHCSNSIPHGVELGVMMEPVIYLPRSASASRGKRRSCSSAVPDQRTTSKEEKEITSLTDNMKERNHLTSAYR